MERRESAYLRVMEEAKTGYIAWWDQGVLREGEFGLGTTEITGALRVIFSFSILDKGETQLSLQLEAQSPHDLQALHIDLNKEVRANDLLFLNGYQSWTETRLYSPKEKILPLRMPFPHLVNTTGDYTLYKNPAREGLLHAWTICALLGELGSTEWWLDTAPNTGYTRFEWDCPKGRLRIVKDVGGMRLPIGKTLLLQVSNWRESGTEIEQGPLQPIPGSRAKRPASGWTSWYNYYTKIDQDIILDNLRAFAYREVPIDFFQIDDGWQPAVGDWLEANKKFPLGMAHIADQVHRHGYKAGLWLAPLIVDRTSSIYHEHRDWLVTHDGEHLVEAGYNPGWGGFFNGTYHVLDWRLPQVQEHLRAVFHRILVEWGYDLVKLDFLFAAALIPRAGLSRGQLMDEAMALLRDCCGDKLILGCGVPLAAAWGRADYCRIGPDIGLNWDMDIARRIHLRERISTRNAIGNAMHRRHLAGRWFANDPDVFILRRQNNDLSPVQQHSLLVMNHIFGDLLFTSDDIGSYDNATMRLYRSTFPLARCKVSQVLQAGICGLIWFEIEGRNYFAANNPSREDQKFALPEGTYHRQGEGFVDGPKQDYLRPFETRVYLRWPDKPYAVAGSDMHLFPGSELMELGWDGQGISLGLHPHALREGNMVIKVSISTDEIHVNGRLKPVLRRGKQQMVVLVWKDGEFL